MAVNNTIQPITVNRPTPPKRMETLQPITVRPSAPKPTLLTYKQPAKVAAVRR